MYHNQNNPFQLNESKDQDNFFIQRTKIRDKFIKINTSITFKV